MRHLEDDIQAAIVRWFDLQHPEIRGRLHHSPNGGQRNVATAARLKAQGVRRGFPDLILPVRRGGMPGLAIELKSPKGRLTAEQTDWLDFLAQQGWLAVCCVGFDAAKDTISGYLKQGAA
jgi:hypothetical protein